VPSVEHNKRGALAIEKVFQRFELLPQACSSFLEEKSLCERRLKSMCFTVRTFLLLLLATASLPLYGTVRLPALFADHMVVQRDEPVHVWGDAEPGEIVTVAFRGMQGISTADSLGRWSVQLSPVTSGGPFVLTIRGTNVITLTDVLVGDVWIASGQSNMGFSLRDAQNAEKEIAGAEFPQLRILNVKQRYASYPQEDLAVKMPWSVCTPASASDFSAVAFFFARDLMRREHVPIGVIESAWGGTPAEAWTSMHALSQDASLMPVFSAWSAMADAEPETLRAEAKEKKEIEKKSGAGGDENLGLPWHPVFNSWAPAALYNGMIAPLTRFPIRGVIWYQGESNADSLRYAVYGRLFQTLIQDWRTAWSQGDFPFLFVQIANFHSGPQDHWPEIREAQREALALANTAMVVTIDIGDPNNIHPTNKQDVGFRLALAARAMLDREPVEASGPLYRSMSREGGILRLYFEHAGKELVFKGKQLQGFEIAGADGNFVSAVAGIDGATVVLSNPRVPNPTQARYAWASDPACNLFNKAGLPASPFRTSTRQAVYAPEKK
jgi:sialate O-acetylesterase